MSLEDKDTKLASSKIRPEERLKEVPHPAELIRTPLTPHRYQLLTPTRPRPHLADFEMPMAFTLFSSLMLLDQVDCTLGRKENVTSLKYLFSKSGHTFRMFTTSSATSSSSAAVFKPSRKCRRVRFPPLPGREREERGGAGSLHKALRAQDDRGSSAQ